MKDGGMILVLFLAVLICPLPALAYIDPISGSIIFQALIAGFAAAAFTLKKYYRNIVNYFSGKKPAESSGDKKTD